MAAIKRRRAQAPDPFDTLAYFVAELEERTGHRIEANKPIPDGVTFRAWCEQLAREMVPRMQQRLVELSPRWRQVLDYRAIGLNNKEIGKLLNLSQRSVSRTLQEMAAYGIVIGDSPARRRKTLAPQWRRCAAAGLQLPLFPPEVTQ